MIDRLMAIVIVSLSVMLFSCEEANHKKELTDTTQPTQSRSANISQMGGQEEVRKSDTTLSQRSRRPQQVSARTNSISNSRHNAITKAVQEVSPAVVSITVTEVVEGGRRLKFNNYYNRFFSVPVEREVSSMGSGFIISKDGLVVTNQHVANQNAKKVVVSLTNGSQYKAKVLGSDELADLSLLKIQADTTFTAAEFGNSDSVVVGEWSLAVGNPFGLFKASQPSVTVGVVSARNRDFRPDPKEPRVYLNMIQTDAAINRGNSGGPLVNSQGKVIGVNTFIFTGGTSGGNVGLGFAIPSNRVQKIIKQLSSTGEVQLGYDAGFETKQMTYNIAARYDLPAVMGLLVESVNRDGPAFEAGIVPGDIILRIGNERIQSKMHAQALLREYSEGDSMRVELVRNSKRYETKMMLRRKIKE
ncbi:serine protease Do [Fodinibius salinus]|uniref:Serine protease Do n=1 Tax=Fodinibius salinus TaxID=860790 RepID=A0A5D3YJA6_9BACT|nr:trypsin-like peptidase domain-containing protein [Fodinibius salinus]TYP93924.1 serine protease Do [Fodinibius salinus]